MRWLIALLVFALAAGAVAFGGFGGEAQGLARGMFFLCIIALTVAGIVHTMHRRPPL